MAEVTSGSYKKFLAALLRRSGTTKAELAKRTGVTPSYISQIFGNYPNTSPPSTERLRQLAEALEGSQAEIDELIRLAVLERAAPDERALFERLEVMLAQSRSSSGFRLPLVAEVPCNRFTWVASEEPYAEYVDLDVDEYVPGGFVIRARGDSMSKVIMDGDLLVFDPARSARNGDIVCAQLSGEDEGSTIKYYYDRGAAVELRPENNSYQSIILVKDTGGRLIHEGRKVLLSIKGVLKAQKRLL